MKLRQFGIVAFAVCSLMAGFSGNCKGSPYGEFVLHVDDDAPAGGDGHTWKTAYRFLQDALMFAAEPENGVSEIRTAQGVYRPDRTENNPKGDGDREGTFQLINGVSLLGGYAGIGADDPDERDIELYETILSGDLLGDDEADFKNNNENSFHVVTGSLTINAVIDGFTVTAGNANDSSNNSLGAGMFNSFQEQIGTKAGPQVSNCVFVLNSAYKGGGIWIGYNSNPQINNCKFIANSATLGGGIHNRADDARITGYQFIGNTAILGGGIVDISDAIINNCDFIDNLATWGGGIYLIARKTLIINCSFFNNVADAYGGGMYSEAHTNTSPTLANCIFSYNTVKGDGYGGAIFAGGDGLGRFINLTITNNIAGTDGGIYFYGNLHVSNSIIWGNKNGQITYKDGDDDELDLLISNNCIEGGYKGAGNIDSDPLFVDPENNDYRLLPGSPCIDSGFNNAVPRDSADLDSDEDFKEFIPFDFDGNPRFVDDPASIDVGCGVMGLVDMGAFEFQDGKAAQPLPGDFDGDGVITLDDLIELLSEWGQCDSCCVADLDVNGSVSTSDLLLFFSFWN